MNWYPGKNALLALCYITLVVLFLQWLETFKSNTPDTIIDGIGFISLFTFSAAVMAFLFFYRPVVHLLAGQPQAALTYFLQTLGIFGVITIGILLLVIW